MNRNHITFPSTTGVTHVVEGDADQTVLHGQDDQTLYIRSRCGHEMELRRGDLTEHDGPLQYHADFCMKCALSLSAFELTDSTGEVEERREEARERLLGEA